MRHQIQFFLNKMIQNVKDRYLILSVTGLLFTISGLQSQTMVDSSLAGLIISKIETFGNNKTKSKTIFREMQLQPGDSLNWNIVELDRKRIESLRLFNRVIIYVLPENEHVILSIHVTEQWYLIPNLILYINEHDWKKVSYGIILHHYNFRGLAEIIEAGAKFGYNPSYKIGYSNPWFGGNKRLTTKIVVAHNRTLNHHFQNQDVKRLESKAEWWLGKRLNLHTSINGLIGYRGVSLSPPVEEKTLNPTGKDNMFLTGLMFYMDYRDLIFYPHSGWFFLCLIQNNRISEISTSYSQMHLDIRVYRSVKQSTFALQTKTNLTTGEVPVYDRVYLGYGERIRGHFREKREGENNAIARIGFRFPLVPIHYYQMAGNPELSDLRFGIGMSIFIDTGLTWFQNESPALRNLSSGYGIGVHFHLPYQNIFRLESAWNEQGNQEWIIDMNVDI